MRPNTRRPVAAANTAAGRGSPDPACILAENISDRGGDCAKNCTPRNVDDGQLHGPVPQRRKVAEIVGRVGEEAEQRAVEESGRGRAGLQRWRDGKDHEAEWVE